MAKDDAIAEPSAAPAAMEEKEGREDKKKEEVKEEREEEEGSEETIPTTLVEKECAVRYGLLHALLVKQRLSNCFREF